MMYKLCEKYSIPHQKTGKLIIATNDEGIKSLPLFFQHARASGGKDLELLNSLEIKEKCGPNVEGLAGVWCPHSGIVDSHALGEFYEQDFRQNYKDTDVVTNHEVIGIEKFRGIPAYKVRLQEITTSGRKAKYGDISEVNVRTIVNCAGLGSGRIAAMLGLDIDQLNYRINPVKGSYFRVTKQLDKYPKPLIYPLPLGSCVGVHTTPDNYGGMRLGPYDEWNTATINNAIYAAKKENDNRTKDTFDSETPSLSANGSNLIMDINDLNFRGYYGSMHNSVLTDLTVGGGKDNFHCASSYLAKTMTEKERENEQGEDEREEERGIFHVSPCKSQEELKEIVYQECKSYLPFLNRDDMMPDGVGFHPKRQKTSEEGMQDWILKHEKDNGLPNVYSCIGIESPGITASEAIGEYMANLVEHTSQ